MYCLLWHECLNEDVVVCCGKTRAREEELLGAAEAGDLVRVRRICSNDRYVNINCTDPLGRTPLHLAVTNEQKDVAHFLLGRVDTRAAYQALMLAINYGHDEIAEMIIGKQHLGWMIMSMSNVNLMQSVEHPLYYT